MKPHYTDDSVTLYHGDCLDVLRELPDASVDAVVTDPPYNLSFMSRSWDRFDGQGIDPGFMHWLAGFIDGEGCFHVHKKPQKTYDCQFTITLRADDRPILERIQRTLGMGTLSKPTAHRTGSADRKDNPKARYNISRKADLVRLRDLLRAFPLRAKKATDFEIWSDALDAWVDHEVGEWDELAELRDVLMANRTYSEEGVRVDPFQMWCWRWARECFRVLKPGGHLLAFGGSRTSHRLTAGIEDAGFEIRDSIAWVYAQGFPKSSKPYRRMTPCPSTEHAPHAVRLSPWNPVESPEAKAPTALALAEIQPGGDPALLIRTGAEGGSCEVTAMSWSVLTATTSLNTVTSWSSTSAESWGRESKSTIATVTEPTTVSKILKCLTSFPTPTSTPPDVTRPLGCECSVARVVSSSTDDKKNKQHTLTLIAPEPAISPVWWAEGFGTAAKPAFEPIVVARKPLAGTVAANVLTHGTGALNIDGCRVDAKGDKLNGGRISTKSDGWDRPWKHDDEAIAAAHARGAENVAKAESLGRWPANVVLDESQAAALDAMSGERGSGTGAIRASGVRAQRDNPVYGTPNTTRNAPDDYGDSGGASRFFPTFKYEPKAPTTERPNYFGPSCECEDSWPTVMPSPVRATDATTAPASSSTSKSGNGTTGSQSPKGSKSTTSTATSSTTTQPTSSHSRPRNTNGSTPAANSATANGSNPAASADSSSPSDPPTGISAAKAGRSTDAADLVTSPKWSARSVCGECGAPSRREAHATVKPLDLMRWLVRLVTPPGGTVLEPFAGSGTTAEACVIEGFQCIAIEREADYLPLIVARLTKPIQVALI